MLKIQFCITGVNYMTVFLYFDHINAALASIWDLFQKTLKILPNPNLWILVYVNIIKRLCYLVSVFLRLKCRSVCSAGWGTFAGGAEASSRFTFTRAHRMSWPGNVSRFSSRSTWRSSTPSSRTFWTQTRMKVWTTVKTGCLFICTCWNLNHDWFILSLCRSWSHVQSCVTDHWWIGRTKETSGDAHL